MLKKLAVLIVVLSALSMSAQAFWKSDITMLVVPREALPVQIAQDISRRYPVLLVCYYQVRGETKIHAWNGDDWVAVPVEDYTNGTFFANRPKHAIIVESDYLRAPQALVPNSIWCESASRIVSTDPRVLIHLLGLHFDFPFSYWNQFATRYNYSIEEINPTLQNVHWWNLSGDALAEKRAKRDFSVDLNKRHYLSTIPPPVIRPVVLEEGFRVVPEVEVPASEPVKVIKVTAPESPDPVTKSAPSITPPAAPVSKPAPAIKPVSTVMPAPAPLVETPAVPASGFASAIVPAPIPALKPAPAAKQFPSLKPNPVIEPTLAAEPAPAPLIEAPAAPAAAVTDPFSTEEIPAAEIVVPPAPKKPWWKRL